MSKFTDLLSKPLPSAMNANVNESALGDGEMLDDTVTPVEPVAPVEPVEPTPAPVVPEVPVTPAVPAATEPATDLTPDESQKVDEVMNAVATPLLIKNEFASEDDYSEFVESVDSDIAVAEGFLTERTIVKFDKNAKKAQLYEVAVAAVAREKKDPLYKKLETVYKMERILKAKLRKKYHAQANAKVKEYLQRAKKSKSGILAKIAAKLTGK